MLACARSAAERDDLFFIAGGIGMIAVSCAVGLCRTCPPSLACRPVRRRTSPVRTSLIAHARTGCHPRVHLGVHIHSVRSSVQDVVDRNIKKALDPVTADYRELTYEAYGFGGVGFVVNVSRLCAGGAPHRHPRPRAYPCPPTGLFYPPLASHDHKFCPIPTAKPTLIPTMTRP
jgi:hypothetical protein